MARARCPSNTTTYQCKFPSIHSSTQKRFRPRITHPFQRFCNADTPIGPDLGQTSISRLVSFASSYGFRITSSPHPLLWLIGENERESGLALYFLISSSGSPFCGIPGSQPATVMASLMTSRNRHVDAFQADSQSFRIHEDAPSTEDTEMNESALQEEDEAEQENEPLEEEDGQNSDYSDSSEDEPPDEDSHFQQDMEKLQNAFVGFRQKYRLIKRIGEG